MFYEKLKFIEVKMTALKTDPEFNSNLDKYLDILYELRRISNLPDSAFFFISEKNADLTSRAFDLGYEKGRLETKKERTAKERNDVYRD